MVRVTCEGLPDADPVLGLQVVAGSGLDPEDVGELSCRHSLTPEAAEVENLGFGEDSVR